MHVYTPDEMKMELAFTVYSVSCFKCNKCAGCIVYVVINTCITVFMSNYGVLNALVLSILLASEHSLDNSIRVEQVTLLIIARVNVHTRSCYHSLSLFICF